MRMGTKFIVAVETLGWALVLWGLFRVSLTLGIVASGITLMVIGISQIEVKKGDST